jgi:hypothetical protein
MELFFTIITADRGKDWVTHNPLFIAHHQFFVKCWKQITVLLQLANASPLPFAKDRFPPLLSQSFLSVFLLQIFTCWFRTKGKQSNLATIGPDGNCTKYCPFLKTFLFSVVGRCTVLHPFKQSTVVRRIAGGSQPVSTAVHMEPK